MIIKICQGGLAAVNISTLRDALKPTNMHIVPIIQTAQEAHASPARNGIYRIIVINKALLNISPPVAFKIDKIKIFNSGANSDHGVLIASA